MEFVSNIVDAFEISENGTHVGVLYYSDDAVLHFDFNKFRGTELNKQNVIDEIKKIKVTTGQTRIDLALMKAHDELFSLKGGMRPNKPKVNHIGEAVISRFSTNKHLQTSSNKGTSSNKHLQTSFWPATLLKRDSSTSVFL